MSNVLLAEAQQDVTTVTDMEPKHATNVMVMEGVTYVMEMQNAMHVMATLLATLAKAISTAKHVAALELVPNAMVSPNAVPAEVMAIVLSVITATEYVPHVMA